MDTEQLSQAVMAALEAQASLTDPRDEVQPKTVFDRQNRRFQLVKHGWKNDKRYFYSVGYVEVADGLAWIWEDNTEIGIANLLLERAIPRDAIVLAFHPPQYRKYTEFNPGQAPMAMEK